MLPKQEILSNFAHYYKDNPMKNDKEMKTITIRQGSGDDALEMTVQVTQAEFDKMEELRSINPQKWPDYSLELIKEAREVLAKPTKQKPKKPQSTNKSKRKRIWIVLAIILAAMGIAIWYFTRNTSVVQGNDLAFNNLYGPVKNVYTLEFDAINTYGKGVLDKPSIDDLTILRFDSLGNQTMKNTFNVSYCDLREVNKNNFQGQLIEKRYYYKGKCSGSFNYEYNIKGEKTKCTSEGNLGIDFLDEQTVYSYTYQHDNKGRIILEKDYTDGSLSTTIKTEYDALGRVITTYSEDPIYGYGKTEYQYTADGYFKQSLFDGFDYKEFTSEKWVFDRQAGRNDKYVYDENSKLNGKISYYYDEDSIFYMEKCWNAEGELLGTSNHLYIVTPIDSVFFTTMQNDNSISSTLYITRPILNGFEKRKFDIKPELTSSMTAFFDNPFHRLVTRNDGATLSMDYDKKRNPKSAIHTFDDGETIITKYSYSGREKRWKRVETSRYDNGKKETTTNTYSGYNLLSAIESNGHEEYWEYNEQGEEVSYRELKGGVTISNIKYSDFVNDKYGNWIRRTNYNVLADTYTVTERCIKYY